MCYVPLDTIAQTESHRPALLERIIRLMEQLWFQIVYLVRQDFIVLQDKFSRHYVLEGTIVRSVHQLRILVLMDTLGMKLVRILSFTVFNACQDIIVLPVHQRRLPAQLELTNRSMANINHRIAFLV